MGLFDKLKKKETPSKKVETEILIGSNSPVCPAEAFAEADGQTVYFYLRRFPDTPEQTISSCFVCNLLDQSHVIPIAEWKKDPSGPPMIPYDQVTHNPNGLTLDADELEIVWTMEGSGAGLLHKGELIAFIPEWAAHENFPGYSRYLKGETPFGWEMTQAREHLEEVIQAGRDFWARMEGDFWPALQDSQVNTLEAFFGQHEQYFAIDGGQFPPRALVTGEKDGVNYGITLGMSLLRQPMVESFYQEKTPDFSRVELGFACAKEHEAVFMPVLQQIAGAASIPWRKITSLGHGHTIKLSGIEGFPAVWLLNDHLLKPGDSLKYEDAFGERVNLLWLVPITQEEYDFLLGFDMEKRLFSHQFSREMIVFDGSAKVPLERLKELAERPTERNEIDNQELKDTLASHAIGLLKQGEDYGQMGAFPCEFGYLYDIEEHGVEALFKLTTDQTVCYFAAQKESLMRLDFTEELFQSTTEGFLNLHQ